MTSLGRWVTYITPSTTSGLDCHTPTTWFCSTHCSCSFLTFFGVIWVSGL